jgi:hypothetical protein
MAYFDVETEEALINSPKITNIPGLDKFLTELNKAEDDWDRYLHDEMIGMTCKFGKPNAQTPEQKKFTSQVMDSIDEYVSDNSFNSDYSAY